MKKVVTAGIGGRSFVIDEDAYYTLDQYLAKFRQKTGMGLQSGDVMEDLEERIAELFSEALGSRQEVVNIALVNRVISRLGMPDGSSIEDDFGIKTDYSYRESRPRKLFRNPDDKMLGGVCSGLAHYLNVDTALIRVLFVVAIFMGTIGFWVYIILWIIAPMAYTATQKCEMRGISVTAENLARFSSNSRR